MKIHGDKVNILIIANQTTTTNKQNKHANKSKQNDQEDIVTVVCSAQPHLY